MSQDTTFKYIKLPYFDSKCFAGKSNPAMACCIWTWIHSKIAQFFFLNVWRYASDPTLFFRVQ